MYLQFCDVTLIDEKLAAKRGITEQDCQPVFERELRGQRILTLTNELSRFAGDAKLYGKIYWSAGEPCVIPNTWDWDDVYGAKSYDHSSCYL